MNAGCIYRGSTITPTNRITLPASTKEAQTAHAVESCMNSMQSLKAQDGMDRARTVWTEMLDAKSYTIHHSDRAGLQFPTIRDQLVADIPGVDEPMDRVLLAQTHSTPH